MRYLFLLNPAAGKQDCTVDGAIVLEEGEAVEQTIG